MTNEQKREQLRDHLSGECRPDMIGFLEDHEVDVGDEWSSTDCVDEILGLFDEDETIYDQYMSE